jgi:hypothetical protein
VSRKAAVLSGAPDQASGGETFLPSHVNRGGIGPPSVMAGLLRVNEPDRAAGEGVAVMSGASDVVGLSPPRLADGAVVAADGVAVVPAPPSQAMATQAIRQAASMAFDRTRMPPS